MHFPCQPLPSPCCNPLSQRIAPVGIVRALQRLIDFEHSSSRARFVIVDAHLKLLSIAQAHRASCTMHPAPRIQYVHGKYSKSKGAHHARWAPVD